MMTWILNGGNGALRLAGCACICLVAEIWHRAGWRIPDNVGQHEMPVPTCRQAHREAAAQHTHAALRSEVGVVPTVLIGDVYMKIGSKCALCSDWVM
jgi:hypothetical protein